MTELKPCPFCKAEGDMLSVWEDNDYIEKMRKYVYCHKCGAQGPRAETDEEAVEGWNENRR